jgi:hypothetical protein
VNGGGYAETVMPNYAIAVLTSVEILIMRESWGKWQLVEDQDYLEELIGKQEGGAAGQDLIPLA